jgi:hypothetical protein
MNTNSKTTKISSYTAILFGSLWLGTYLSRLILSYQLFEKKDFVLKTIFNDVNLSAVFQVLYPIIVLQIILYIVFLISFVVFWTTCKINIRNNGWFFIIIIIILTTLPLEVYLISIDYKLVSIIYYNSYTVREVLNLIIKRFKVLGSFPIIEILLFSSCYYFILYKPLTKIQDKDENQRERIRGSS